jgi:hypothetical protein
MGTTTDKLCGTYLTCAIGVEVSLCSISRADHVLYTDTQNSSVPKVAWECSRAIRCDRFLT